MLLGFFIIALITVISAGLIIQRVIYGYGVFVFWTAFNEANRPTSARSSSPPFPCRHQSPP